MISSQLHIRSNNTSLSLENDSLSQAFCVLFLLCFLSVRFFVCWFVFVGSCLLVFVSLFVCRFVHLLFCLFCLFVLN